MKKQLFRIMLGVVLAGMSFSQGGDSLSLYKKVQKTPIPDVPTNAGIIKDYIPGEYKTLNIPKNDLNALKQMGQANVNSGDRVSQLASRELDHKIVIDPLTHPAILQSNEIVKNPLNVLNVVEVTSDVYPEKNDRHVCHEGEESSQVSCLATLVAKQMGTKKEDKIFVVDLNVKDIILDPQKNIIVRTSDQFMGNPYYSQPTNPEVLKSFRSLGNIIDAITGQGIDIDLSSVTSVKVIQFYGPTIFCSIAFIASVRLSMEP